jgi:CRP/FNR family transcriptional regulator, nitrogen oxide reductase regulator
MMSSREIKTVFFSAELFRGLDAASVDGLIASGFRRSIPRGGELLRQGDPSEFLYLVVDGRFKVTHLTPHGERVTLRFLGSGELVGCAAVFHQTPYPASALAVTDAVVLGWTSAQIMSSIQHNPVLARNALRTLGGRVEELLSRVTELSSEPVEQRLANAILRLMRDSGRPAGTDGADVAFTVTRQDLAELTGATHYTVSRVLSRWAKDMIISRGRERIVVRNADRLADIASG